MKSIYLLSAFLILLFVAQSTPSTTKVNRARTVDISNYTYSLSFNRTTKTVFGEATVTFKPLADGLAKLELDARAIKFSSVLDAKSGKTLKYSYDSKTIAVELPKALDVSEEFAVKFKYSAVPKKGIYFVPALMRSGKEVRSAQIWTQGEAEETRYWLPSYDFPDDKATTEQFITVPDGETAIGNGRLIESKLNRNKTRTFHYKTDFEHSIYLTSFVIGKYLKVSDTYGDVPLGYYVYPGQEALAKKAFAKTKDMMRVFEEVTEIKYPFNKYDQIIAARFPFGGMENITATTLADTEIQAAGTPFGQGNVDDLVAHELAHSWFGNMVTCRNWAELWLNESFASYMEAVYRERSKGRSDYLRKINEDANMYFSYSSVSELARHGLFNTTADPENDETMFDPVTYNKGSAILHTLREEIGDEAFWSGVRSYLKANAFKNVETGDLKKAFEISSGRDLGWFFDQWMYRTGHPEIGVEQTFDKETGEFALEFVQTAAKSDKPLNLYVLPLEILVRTSQKTFREKIVLKERSQRITIQTVLKPERVEIDPEHKIPLKDLNMPPLEEPES